MKYAAAWAAGFLDGEGCIRIAHHRGKTGLDEYFLVVTVGQVSRRPLDRLKGLYGGNIYAIKARGNHQAAWDWRIYGSEAMNMLREVEPFMAVKQEEARSVINGFHMPGVGRKLTDEQRESRRLLSLNLQQRRANYSTT